MPSDIYINVIIESVNGLLVVHGLLPVQSQAIAWTHADVLLFGSKEQYSVKFNRNPKNVNENVANSGYFVSVSMSFHWGPREL